MNDLRHIETDTWFNIVPSATSGLANIDYSTPADRQFFDEQQEKNRQQSAVRLKSAPAGNKPSGNAQIIQVLPKFNSADHNQWEAQQTPSAVQVALTAFAQPKLTPPQKRRAASAVVRAVIGDLSKENILQAAEVLGHNGYPKVAKALDKVAYKTHAVHFNNC